MKRRVVGKPLDTARLNRLLTYNPDTGDIRWSENPRPGCKTGELAGSVRGDGYRRIDIQGRVYSAHRLAIWLKTGEKPLGFVGFHDGNRNNLKWENLIVGTLEQIVEAKWLTGQGSIKKVFKSGVRRISGRGLWGAYNQKGRLIIKCSAYEGAAAVANKSRRRKEADLTANEFYTTAIFTWS